MALRFTHYFGGDKTDKQYAHFKSMMLAVTDGAPRYFSIHFECSGTVPDCNSGRS